MLGAGKLEAESGHSTDDGIGWYMDKQELNSFEQDKIEWRQFCETEPSVTIYQQPWYWDAVCDHPDDWRVILIKKDGTIEAAFPFVYLQHHFIWYI